MPAHAAILDHVAPALLVIFRIGGLMIYAPVLSAAVIPARVKVFASFLIGIVAYSLLSARGLVSLEPSESPWMLVPLVALEALLGLVIGFLASLPLLAMQTGGLLMGQQMGLGFAQLYNPAIDDEGDVVGQALFFMALASFLVAGGHEWLVLAVLNSFEHVPVGAFAASSLSPQADWAHDLLGLAAGLITASLELALRVAAPVLALVFLETVAMGFIARTVPQLNILSLGFPLRILLGLAAVAMALVVINDVALDAIGDMIEAIGGWIEGLGSGFEGALKHHHG